MKRVSKVWLLLAAVAAVCAALWLFSGGKKEREIEFVECEAQIMNLQNSITATGTIEPVTQVTVGTQV